MGWTETVMTALFGEGGDYLRLSSKNTSFGASSSTPVDPAAPLDLDSDGTTEAAAVDVPKVTLRELKKATRSFSDKTLIGEGRYAKVYKASLRSGATVAAKRLGRPSAMRWEAFDLAFLVREVAAASRLRHENLVRLLGYNVTADLQILLYEYAPIGTLHDALHGLRGETPPAAGACRSWPTLVWAHRVRIALDAAKGLAYLHEKGVTHHDVRSTNVLLFQGFRAKIADYDVFKQLPEKDVESDYAFVQTCAARGCSPPELCETGHLTQKTDVFSFGAVLLELLTGNNADDHKSKMVVHYGASLRFDPKLGRQYPRDKARKLAMIALRCLRPQPASRPSMATVASDIQECLAGSQGCSVEC